MPVHFPGATLRLGGALTGLLIVTYVLSYPVLPDGGALLGSPGWHPLIAFPHGAKILIAWMMGWASVVVVLPVAILMKLVLQDGHLTRADAVVSVLGALAGPVAFDLFLWAGFDLRRNGGHRVRWQGITLVGLVASVLKLFGACLLMQLCGMRSTTPVEQLSYLAADTVGLILLLLILMLAFRIRRGTD